MIKVLPFSALKRHLQGEIFTPVDMGAHYELQSATRVMCGSNGNTYRFKTAENAALWLDTNTIKAVKNQITKQSAIDSLIIKQMSAPSDWLAEEIATLQARANGDWATFHAGEDLLTEWGIVAKGDKGDAGVAGISLVAGNTLQVNAALNTAINHPHGLGKKPDFYQAKYICNTPIQGYVIGDSLPCNIGMLGAIGMGVIGVVETNEHLIYRKVAHTNFHVTNKNTGVLTSSAVQANSFDFVITPYKLG